MDELLFSFSAGSRPVSTGVTSLSEATSSPGTAPSGSTVRFCSSSSSSEPFSSSEAFSAKNFAVLNQRLQRIREAWHLRELGLQHFQFDDHVPEQLAPCRVRKGAIECELVDLADIVQESAGKQEVAINLRIVAAHQVAGIKQRHYVLQQTSDESVMQSLGGRRIAVSFCNFRIGHEGLNQCLEMGIPKSSHKARQGPPHLADVFSCLRQVIGEIDFGFSHAAKLVDGELEPVLVLIDQPLDLDEVILAKGVDRILDVVPHLAFDVPAA